MATKNGKLTNATEAWVKQIETDYVLGSHQKMLLRAAGEAWDRSRECRQAIARDGMFVRSARGLVIPHPGVKAERDAVKSFQDLLKQLDLAGELDPDALWAVRQARPR
jgi:hypothetical protein